MQERRTIVISIIAVSCILCSVTILLVKLQLRPLFKTAMVLGGVLLVTFIVYLTIRKVRPRDMRSNKGSSLIKDPKPKKDDKEELVIAVCGEDLSWVDNKAKEYHKVTVYNKCGKDIKFEALNIVVQDNPNIGSCDYAFLTYIIERYNDLPEFIEFTKGSQPGNHKYQACLPCYTDNDISAIKLNKLKKFNLNGHGPGGYRFANHPKLDKKFPWVPSGHQNFKSWLDEKGHVDLVDRSYCNIIYGGHFGATREQIKRTPLKVYEALKKEQKYPREEVDHFIERLWRPLLCRPKYNLVVVGIFKNEAVAILE